MPKSFQNIKNPSQSLYVDSQVGWRLLFFGIAIGCILGLSFRIYFSPERVKALVVTALEDQSARFGLQFKGAFLRLSRGAIPEFSVVLTDVELSPAARCHPEPSLSMAELRLPFRFSSLFTGRVGLGTIGAEDVVVDLDGLKVRCPEGQAQEPSRSPPSLAPGGEKTQRSVRAVASTEDSKPSLSTQPAPLARWWSSAQLNAIAGVIDGFEFSRVKILFEQKRKHVVLESFSARPSLDQEIIHLQTDLRIPREVAFGESLPPLSISAEVHPTFARVDVSATLSEGRLEGRAVLRATGRPSPDIETNLEFKEVPVSTLVPLLTKAGIVSEKFKPRFMWLDCKVSINGPFQGLFRSSPLGLSDCAVEGHGARVQIDRAVRKTDGSWEPLVVQFTKIDLRRFFETFSISGPDGVASQFGFLSGQLNLESPEAARFEGAIEGAELRFSNQSIRSPQKVQKLEAAFELVDGRVRGAIENVLLTGGEFEGKIDFDFEKRLKSGDIKGQIKKLKLAPEVQRLMTGGSLESIEGDVYAQFFDGQVDTVKGALDVRGLYGNNVRFAKAHLSAERLDQGVYQILFKSPEVGLLKESPLMKAALPLFFEHQFEEDWIDVSDAHVQAFIPPAGGIEWTKATGSLEQNRIRLSSSGNMTRSRVIEGSVSVDYPAVKRLKWNFTGSFAAPIFIDDSPSLTELRRRLRIDDRVLGLPTKSNVEANDDSMAARTTRGLRELGEKVMKKARTIVPASERLAEESPKSEDASRSDESQEKKSKTN